MTEHTPLILIVEDDLNVAEMLNAFFGGQGYDVHTVHRGEEVERFCRTQTPELVILDIRLPDIDGYEVARRLRSARRTKEVPILFLTEKRSRGDRLHGLELGADDYITKPFDVQELRLRVRNALRRSTGESLNNPVTGLAEGALVDERLSECLDKTDWAILLVNLENLESFREAYGFVASDDVLRAVSLMVHNADRDLGRASDFIGQISPTGFILITQPQLLADLRERIRSRLEQALEYFYPLKDRDRERAVEKRLAVRLGQLTANQGPFQDVQHLKSQILQQLHVKA